MTQWLPIAHVLPYERHLLALGFGRTLPSLAKLVREALDEHRRERHAEAGIQWVLAVATIAAWSCGPILPRLVERRGLDGVDRWSMLAVGDAIEWMDATRRWHGPERITRFETVNHGGQRRLRVWFGERLGVMDYAMRDVRITEPSPHDVLRD